MKIMPFGFLNKIVTGGFNTFMRNKFTDTAPFSINNLSSSNILISGNFTNFNGIVGRNKSVKVSIDGVIDETFESNAVDGSKFNQVSDPDAISPMQDGSYLIGGRFTNYAGASGRSYLIKVSSSGVLDTTFCSNIVDGSKFNAKVATITQQADGKILIGGSFTNYGGISGRNNLIRLNADYTLDTTFNANIANKFNGIVIKTVVQLDGKIIVTGGFTNYGGVSGKNLVIRLNANGTEDTAFSANAVDSTKFSGTTVFDCKTFSDGKILFMGSFNNYAGVSGRNRYIRLNNNGTVDTAFAANAVDSNKAPTALSGFTILSDDSIIIYGNFTSYNGDTTIKRVFKLNNDGTTNNIFNSNLGASFNASVDSVIKVQSISSDYLFYSGTFTTFNGQSYRCILKTDASGIPTS